MCVCVRESVCSNIIFLISRTSTFCRGRLMAFGCANVCRPLLHSQPKTTRDTNYSLRCRANTKTEEKLNYSELFEYTRQMLTVPEQSVHNLEMVKRREIGAETVQTPHSSKILNRWRISHSHSACRDRLGFNQIKTVLDYFFLFITIFCPYFTALNRAVGAKGWMVEYHVTANVISDTANFTHKSLLQHFRLICIWRWM